MAISTLDWDPEFSAELAAAQKELEATRLQLQEAVNRHLSPAVIPALVHTREEGIDGGIDDVSQSLPGATWLLVRFGQGIYDLVDFFVPGDYTIATSDPDEPSKLIAYSLRQGFDIVVDRDQVELVPTASIAAPMSAGASQEVIRMSD